jgi:8-oxo-dGTP diphosphatase
MAGSSYQVIPRVLCFLECDDKVLLIRRAAHKRLWPNLYNGVGGHMEPGETPLEAAFREIHEETGLPVKRLDLRAVIHVDREGEGVGVLLFVFTGRANETALQASPEGTPQWVHKKDVFGLDLLSDLHWLLPKLWSLPPSAPPFFARTFEDRRGRISLMTD